MTTTNEINLLAEMAKYELRDPITLINLGQELVKQNNDFFPVNEDGINTLAQEINHQLFKNDKTAKRNIIQNIAEAKMPFIEPDKILNKRNWQIADPERKHLIKSCSFDNHQMVLAIDAEKLIAKDKLYFLPFNEQEKLVQAKVFTKQLAAISNLEQLASLLAGLDSNYHWLIASPKKAFQNYLIDNDCDQAAKKYALGLTNHYTFITQFLDLIQNYQPDKVKYLRDKKNKIYRIGNKSDYWYNSDVYDSLEYPDIFYELYSSQTKIKTVNTEFYFKVTNPKLMELIKAYFVLSTIKYLQKGDLDFKHKTLKASVAKMLYLQLQNNHTQLKKTSNGTFDKKFSDTMKQFMIGYSINDIDARTYANYSLLDLMTLVKLFIQQKPLPINLFSLIVEQGNRKQLYDQAIKLHLENKLSPISADEKAKLLSKISSRIVQGHNHHGKITQIYKINDKQPAKTGKHLMLAHGTKDFSVLNILGQGLLDAATLFNTHNQHFSYTGNGLGSGIYFARLDQMEKSLNYTHGNASYVFICDVNYHKMDTIRQYDTEHIANGDLVYGKAVGSYDRDEYVAKSSKQVTLLYLLKIE